MENDELALALALAENVHHYETKTLKNGLKVLRSVYKHSKMLLKALKSRFADVIPVHLWDYICLNSFYGYIKSGKAESVRDAVELYEQSLKNVVDGLEVRQ